MSAIAGIWQWNGHPVDPADAARLASYSRVAGPDGGGIAAPEPALHLQAHLLHFDSLSATEQQPWKGRNGTVVTWDGRLDNRDDLQMTLHRAVGPVRTDVALVTAAYERWGLDAFPRLIGDWSLAIWDAPRRAVVLACDYAGNRPLYYRATPDRLVWATRLEALAAACGLFSQPELTFVAAALAGTAAPREITPFQGARRLRAGYQLIAARHGDEPKRYWTFVPSTVRAPDAAAYAEQLRVLLTDAVRVRMRASRPVWAHLSGGWDSSSVVCLAHILAQRGMTEAAAVQPISVVCPTAPESDESFFISAVERWLGLETVRYPFTNRPNCTDRQGQLRPDAVSLLLKMEARIQAAGGQVVLSGELGDTVMGRSGTHAYALLEPLYAGHPFRFLRLAAARSRYMQRPMLTTLSRALWEGYMPTSWRRARQRRRVWDQSDENAQNLTPMLRAHYARYQWGTYPSVRTFPRATRVLVATLYDQLDHGRLTSPDVEPPVWRTHPYTHRPLVEFVLAAPLSALWEPTATRAGMARALSSILPAELLARTSKGDMGTAFLRASPGDAEELTTTSLLPAEAQQWQLVRRGYLQPEPLRVALAEARAGAPTPGLLGRAAHLELWLDALAVHTAAEPRPTQASSPASAIGGHIARGPAFAGTAGH